ncbi:MAG TPA: hypothetical protein VH681_11010 [Nitrospiraceae bacterium]|jgi:hypothetical protein
MAFDMRVIPISEFLRTDVSGTIDFEASRAILRELLAVCAQHNVRHILIDTREASSKATSVDVWSLANDLGNLGVSTTHRIAILNRPKDDFDRGAFLELCATNRGYQLRAFRDFELAFTWLTTEESATA